MTRCYQRRRFLMSPVCSCLFIYIYIYIYILWRGNTIPLYIPWLVGKRAATLWPSADDSKQNNGKKGSLSLSLSRYLSLFLLLQGDMSMGEPHSLLAIYASAGRQTCDHDGYWGRNRQKTNTWWIFKLRQLS